MNSKTGSINVFPPWFLYGLRRKYKFLFSGTNIVHWLSEGGSLAMVLSTQRPQGFSPSFEYQTVVFSETTKNPHAVMGVVLMELCRSRNPGDPVRPSLHTDAECLSSDY